MKTVYLAGPISGLTFTGASDWRTAAIEIFNSHNIAAKSPMRGKEILRNLPIMIDQGYPDNPLTSQHGIVTRDRNDTQTCDVVLMNLLGATTASIGSMVELGWADSKRIPVVTVLDLADQSNPHKHAFVRELSGFIVPTLQEAIDICLSLLNTTR